MKIYCRQSDFKNPDLVEGKDYCFNLQAYKAYKMNYLDDRNDSFY